MIVATSNKASSIIDKVDLEIIKRVDGQFELSELLSKFANLYFDKMIIDITSIKGYQDKNIIKELAGSLKPDMTIIVLPDEAVLTSEDYISSLIENGFYNFTRNVEGIKFLYNNPNDYEAVKHLIKQNEPTDEIRLEDENLVREINIDEVPVQQQVVEENTPTVVVEQSQVESVSKVKSRKVIGIENLTVHAGASSLTNMMVRQLNNQGIKTIGIEMFKQDLIYYRDSRLMFCMNKQDLDMKLKSNTSEAVIIDLNEFGEARQYCDYILYLVEPSNIRLTKLLRKNKNVFLDHKDDRIVLNMSFVNDKEISDFEYEAKIKVYANIPPVNDRNQNIKEVNELLKKLGFDLN